MNGLDSEETVAETKPKQPAKSWSAVAQSSVPVATSSGQSPRGVAVKPSPVGLPSLEEVVRGRNKVLIVLRGLPGSGKSTMVSKLVSDGNAYVCSADDFFVNAAGEYIWDAKRIQEAHQYSQKRALQYFELAISPVIVDNTNTMCWEAKPYVEAAVARGYAVEVLQPTTPWALNPVELAKRNKHNVPEVAIRKMLNRWEEDFTVERILGNGKTGPPKQYTRKQRDDNAALSDNRKQNDNNNLSVEAVLEGLSLVDK